MKRLLKTEDICKVYSVLYRKPQQRKHKSWDGDGFLLVETDKWTLIDEHFNRIAQTASQRLELQLNVLLKIAHKQVQIESLLDPNLVPPRITEMSQRGHSLACSESESQAKENLNNELLFKVSIEGSNKERETEGYLVASNTKWLLYNENRKLIKTAPSNLLLKNLCQGSRIKVGLENVVIMEQTSRKLFEQGGSLLIESASNSLIVKRPLSAPFKPHFASLPKAKKPKLLYDPSKPGAILMPQPENLDGALQVVIDPFLSKHLKPYQADGVKFLYECAMGFRSALFCGSLLADEMGLGKSLQTIALIWTMMKQTPYPNSSPPLQKIILVCPASLMDNWKAEFKKWLGDLRLKLYMVGTQTKSIRDFFIGRVYSVLVINYEKLSKFEKELAEAKFDLLVCDEAHRLKNSDLQSIKVLNLLTKRRILLSGRSHFAINRHVGTPLQNDLLELFHLMNFSNPGLLGTLSHFKKNYVDPIDQGRMENASPLLKERCKQKLVLVQDLIRPFFLRRTSKENEQYLPKKTEWVIFTKLNRDQEEAYLIYLTSIENSDLDSLSSIISLRKLANLPVDNQEILASSKFAAITRLLEKFKMSGEKVVVVSHWTLYLDMFATHLKLKSWSFLRLDGSVSSEKRQKLVDDFNAPNASVFCFLLSSKAGGCGLNLIGASRLVLLDVDWNPAIGEQAMARIWRQGQTKECYIYRFISAGTIEEFMYQRQLSKNQLSESVMDSKDKQGVRFTKEELAAILRYDSQTRSITHSATCQNCTSEQHFESPFSELKNVDPFLDAVAHAKESNISFIALAGSL